MSEKVTGGWSVQTVSYVVDWFGTGKVTRVKDEPDKPRSLQRLRVRHWHKWRRQAGGHYFCPTCLASCYPHGDSCTYTLGEYAKQYGKRIFRDNLRQRFGIGEEVWLGDDLGRVVEVHDRSRLVRFDQHPDGAATSESWREASELEPVSL